MAALTENKEVISKVPGKNVFPVGAAKTIYKGALIMLKSGYAEGAATGAGSYYAGVALHSADNSAGSAGDINVECDHEEVLKLDGFTGLAQTDIGKTVYATDDQTVTLTQGNNIPVGKIVEYINSTTAMVKQEYGGVSI